MVRKRPRIKISNVKRFTYIHEGILKAHCTLNWPDQFHGVQIASRMEGWVSALLIEINLHDYFHNNRHWGPSTARSARRPATERSPFESVPYSPLSLHMPFDISHFWMVESLLGLSRNQDSWMAIPSFIDENIARLMSKDTNYHTFYSTSCHERDLGVLSNFTVEKYPLLFLTHTSFSSFSNRIKRERFYSICTSILPSYIQVWQCFTRLQVSPRIHLGTFWVSLVSLSSQNDCMGSFINFWSCVKT